MVPLVKIFFSSAAVGRTGGYVVQEQGRGIGTRLAGRSGSLRPPERRRPVAFVACGPLWQLRLYGSDSVPVPAHLAGGDVGCGCHCDPLCMCGWDMSLFSVIGANSSTPPPPFSPPPPVILATRWSLGSRLHGVLASVIRGLLSAVLFLLVAALKNREKPTASCSIWKLWRDTAPCQDPELRTEDSGPSTKDPCQDTPPSANPATSACATPRWWTLLVFIIGR